MPATDDLLSQLEHHLRWLARAIEDVDADAARFELAPGRPSIAWLVGHLTAGVDSVGVAVAGLGPGLPRGFDARGSLPHWGVADAAGWAELRAVWVRVAERTRRGLAELARGDLDRPPAVEVLPAFAQRLGTRSAFLAGEVFHVAYHLGQIGSLRAALGLGWG